MHRHPTALRTFALALAMSIGGAAQAAEGPVLIETDGATLYAPFIPGGSVTSLFLETASGTSLDSLVHVAEDGGLLEIVPMHQALGEGGGAWGTLDEVAAFVTAEHVSLFRPEVDDEVIVEAPCWLERGEDGAVFLPHRLIAFDLDSGESVLAASVLDPGLASEVLGLFSLVQGEGETSLRLQVSSADDRTIRIGDLATVSLGEGEVALRSWTQGGKAYVALIGERGLGIGELAWSRDNGAVVVSAFSQYGSHISVSAPGVGVKAYSNYGTVVEIAAPGGAQSFTSEDGTLYLDLRDDQGTTWLRIAGSRIIDSGYLMDHEDWAD